MLTDYFHKNYYPDLTREQVDAAINKDDNTYGKALEVLHKNHYSDIDIEDVKKKVGERKPLVNWFNRTKEFEYGQVLDKNGNPVVDKKSGEILATKKKIVTIPDSVLGGYGGTKTVTTNDRLEKSGGGRRNINIPIPSLLPMLAGAGVANYLVGEGGALRAPDNNATTEQQMIAAAGAVIPSVAGLLGTGKLCQKAINNKKGFYFLDDDAPMGLNMLGAFPSMLTGVPYKQKIGSYNSRAKTRIVTDREKSFESNEPLVKRKNTRIL